MNRPTNRCKRKNSRLLWGASADLRQKVSAMGGQTGLALEIDPTTAPPLESREQGMRSAGIFGGRAQPSMTSSEPRTRLFRSTASSSSDHNKISESQVRSVGASKVSRRSRFSRVSTSQNTGTTTTAVHVVCAISENLARETCVSSLDAGSPTAVQVSWNSAGEYVWCVTYNFKCSNQDLKTR